MVDLEASNIVEQPMGSTCREDLGRALLFGPEAQVAAMAAQRSAEARGQAEAPFWDRNVAA